MSQVFGKILIVDNFNRKLTTFIDNEEDYLRHIEKCKYTAEMIGNEDQKIKPVFDIDAYDNDIDINVEIARIQAGFPNKKINVQLREPRNYNGKMKYSYRIYVDSVQIKWKNMIRLFKMLKLDTIPSYDAGLYTKNRILHTPFTSEKLSKDENGKSVIVSVPPLTPVNCSILDCCASYVLEDYCDKLDYGFDLTSAPEKKKEEEMKALYKEKEDTKEKVVDNGETEKKLRNIIKKLTVKRSDEYHTWTKMNWCIIGICDNYGIGMTKCLTLAHEFSKKSKKYDEFENDNFFDNAYNNKPEKALGWTYLLECLKEDDIKYYNLIQNKVAEDDDEDLNVLVNKYMPEVDDFIEDNNKIIMEAIGDKGSHSTLSQILKKLMKGSIVFDDDIDVWFHCNKYNVWNKRNKPIILKGIIKTVLQHIFMLMGQKFNNMVKPDMDEEEVSKWTKKGKVAQEIGLKLKGSGFAKCIIDMAMIDFSHNCFYEKKIDSLGYLFAFNDKVLDCHTKEIRDIKPKDYIMNTTGYNYPEVIDVVAKKTIEDYYETIYPDENVRSYMWNNDSLLLNGERIFQTFNIHTGSGCNSKSTKFVLLKKVLGEYFIEINGETFTKAPKGANATSELYLAKGRRMVFFNEPESDAENKLQVGLLKKLADGHKAVLKTRGLYMNAIEFPIFFRVEGACNSKPTLSSVDGGIGRRVRIINYPVKFVETPDPTNKYQAKLNNEMVNTLSTEVIRDAYIRVLIDHFIKTSAAATTENVPKQITDDSNEYIADSNVVLGFIMDNYTITNNEKDRIPSSELFKTFFNITKNKMTSSKFKDDMLGISGITYKKTKQCNVFCGLEYKIPDVPDDEEA